jgi:hypothetical protein
MIADPIQYPVFTSNKEAAVLNLQASLRWYLRGDALWILQLSGPQENFLLIARMP